MLSVSGTNKNSGTAFFSLSAATLCWEEKLIDTHWETSRDAGEHGSGVLGINPESCLKAANTN